MLPRRFARVFVVPAVVATYVGLTPGVALASSCSFGAGTVSVAMTNATSVLARDAGGAIRLDGVQCGSATVTTADAIAVSGGAGTLRLDLAEGGFAPGATAETDGISEIEIGWTAVSTAVEVLGSPGADDVSHAATGGINLNGDGDADVTFTQQPASVRIDGGGGDDVLDTSRPQGNANPAWNATVNGGDGNDVLRGDTGADALSGDGGNDVITDGLGDDGTVSGGAGDDTFQAAQAQHDQMNSPQALVDEGVTNSLLNVNEIARADDLEVRVTLTHPDTSTLTLSVTTPFVAEPFVLATARPGTGFHGTLFDDDAATSVTSGAGTYRGRFRPSGGTLRSLHELLPVGGLWTLTVHDSADDGQSGTLVSWAVHTVGSPFGQGSPPTTANGDEAYDGGDGADTLRYAPRDTTITFTAATPTSGTSGDVDEADTYANVETLVGGLGSDAFVGSSGADVWVGGPGSDTFRPGPGNDVIDCGDFHDDDVLDYEFAANGITVDLAAGTALAEGSDEFDQCESVIGTAFNDVVDGDEDGNTVHGLSGNDVITLYGAGDTVSPGNGTDTVDTGDDSDQLLVRAGDGANDTLSGGGGIDAIRYDAESVGVRLSLDDLANDGVVGEADDVRSDIENVTTGDEADVLVGSDGPNELSGGDGADRIDGAGGDDVLHGGQGDDDTVSFGTAPGGVTVSLDAMLATGDGFDFVYGFENVVGTAFADDITGDSFANTVRPGLGNDVVATLDGDDVLVAEPAADGADTWTPSTGDDVADFSLRTGAVSVTLDNEANDGAAGEGDDVPYGVEIVLGGLAGDVLVGGLESDTFFGGPGNDTLLGRGSADTLYGEIGDDAVIGSSGNDTLDGGPGNDSVSGGEGDDRLRGNTGNDTLIGGLGDDDEFGEAGSDKFLQGDTASANGSDLLVGGTETDTVTYSGRSGGVKVDVDGQFDDGQSLELDNVSRDVEAVEGTAYNDTLSGNELANTLRGLGGNDRLTGLLGTDALDGGTGNDTFAEGSASTGKDSFVGGSGVDTVEYTARTSAVRVDLDNVADDGATGEADNVRSDVEYVRGGSGSDTLTGNTGANRLFGNAGNDTLTGGAGVDVLDGGSGNDTLYGRDTLRDSMYGGTGTDRARRDAIDTVASIESYF